MSVVLTTWGLAPGVPYTLTVANVADMRGNLLALNPPCGTPPVILEPPANLPVLEGNPAAFSVIATGAPPLTYVWRFDGTPILDATNSTLSIPVVQTDDVGTYEVVVSGPSGSATSTGATLTLLVPSPQRQWFALDGVSPPDTPIVVRVQSSDLHQTQMDVRMPGFWISTMNYANRVFTRIEMPESRLEGDGLPVQAGDRGWYDFDDFLTP